MKEGMLKWLSQRYNGYKANMPTYWKPGRKDKLLETSNLPKLNHEEVENLNRPFTSKELESGIKNLPTKKKSGTRGPHWWIYQTFKEELRLIFLKLYQKIEEGAALPYSLPSSITLLPKPDKDTTRKENVKSIFQSNTDVKIFNKITAVRIQ